MKDTCPTCDDPCPHCAPTEPIEVTITFPDEGSCEGCECDSKAVCTVRSID